MGDTNHERPESDRRAGRAPTARHPSGERRTGTPGTERGSALREGYDISGDGVARADLARLSNRKQFKRSVRAALEKNGALRDPADLRANG